MSEAVAHIVAQFDRLSQPERLIIRLDRRYLAILHEVQEEGRRHARNGWAGQHGGPIPHFGAKACRILQH